MIFAFSTTAYHIELHAANFVDLCHLYLLHQAWLVDWICSISRFFLSFSTIYNLFIIAVYKAILLDLFCPHEMLSMILIIAKLNFLRADHVVTIQAYIRLFCYLTVARLLFALIFLANQNLIFVKFIYERKKKFDI